MSTTQNAVVAIVDGPLTVPANTVVASVTVTCTGATVGPQPPVSVSATATQAEFDNLPADTYTFTAQAVDQNGNLLGTAVTAQFVITSVTPITVQVPVSISVTQP